MSDLKPNVSSNVLASVVTASILVRDEVLIEKVMTVHPGRLREVAYAELGGALHGLGLAYLHGEGYCFSCHISEQNSYELTVCLG